MKKLIYILSCIYLLSSCTPELDIPEPSAGEANFSKTIAIGGNYMAAINFSSTIPQIFENSQNTDFVIFLDMANVWGVDYDSSIDDSNKLRSSTGVAMNWISPVGPMSFVLATNLSKASTDVTQSFNFQLVSVRYFF